MSRCHRIGCEEAATHQAVLVVPSQDGSPSAQGGLGICLCGDHAAEVDEWSFDSISWALEVMMRQMGFQGDVGMAYAKPVPLMAVN